MVRAWYISDNADIEKKEDCHLDPPQYVGVEDLTALTGVKYFKVGAALSVVCTVHYTLF